MGEEKKQVLEFTKKTVANGPENASNDDINASSVPSEPKMDEAELQVAVARIVVHGTYAERKHSYQDRAYRNVSDDDIQSCLTGPYRLVSVDLGTDRRGRKFWKYEIMGRDLEGEELSLVLNVSKELQKIAIVTKY